MHRRLLPLNAFIALTSTTAAGFAEPRLGRAGWRLVGLEIPLHASRGPSPGSVVADAVAWNSGNGSFLAVEAKSGRNVAADQCHRYHALDPHDLVRALKVDIKRGGPPPRVFVLYATLEQHADSIRFGVASLGYEPLILSVSPFDRQHGTRMALHGSGPVHDELASRVDFPYVADSPVPEIVPLDPQSPVEDFIPKVRAVLVAAQAQRVDVASVGMITETVVPYLAHLGNGARVALQERVRDAAIRIANASPDDFRFKRPTESNREPAVEVLRTPETLDRRGRTQAYQAQSRRGRKAPATPAGQLDLLADLGLNGADTSEEDTGRAQGGGSP